MAKQAAVLNGKGEVTSTVEEAGSELNRAIEDAKRLVTKHFGTVSNLQFADVPDAETEVVYVEISFEVHREVKVARAAYDAFTDEWVKAHPVNVREQIRFVFAVV